MGYYVTSSGSMTINKKDLNEAYTLMCNLNKQDHLKRGGSFGGNGPNINWFSWMDANYPETCKNAGDILDMLGFTIIYDAEGNLTFGEYDNKTGQENLFLNQIKHLLTGQSLNWRGEDGARWVSKYEKNNIFSKQFTS